MLLSLSQRILHSLKKSKMVQTDGKIYHVLGLEESILPKWLYYPRQSTDSMQSLSNYQWHFSQNQNKKFLICMETQKIPNSQNNLEKEQSWRNHTPWVQIIIQSYSNQRSMTLAQKQTHISMEQDREPRNKPMHLWSITLWQRRQEYTMEKRQFLQ